MIKLNAIEQSAYDVGLKVGTWHPGDGAVRYRFFRETEEGNAANAGTGYYDYFGGSNPVITVLGRKAAFAFLEAFRLGRNAGIREAHSTLVHSANADASLEQVQIAIDRLIIRGPWHFGVPLTAEEDAILAAGGRLS